MFLSDSLLTVLWQVQGVLRRGKRAGLYLYFTLQRVAVQAFGLWQDKYLLFRTYTVLQTNNNPKTIVIVPIVRIVVIAIRHARVIVVIVPRPPAQRTIFARLHYHKGMFFKKKFRPLRGIFKRKKVKG